MASVSIAGWTKEPTKDIALNGSKGCLEIVLENCSWGDKQLIFINGTPYEFKISKLAAYADRVNAPDRIVLMKC